MHGKMLDLAAMCDGCQETLRKKLSDDPVKLGFTCIVRMDICSQMHVLLAFAAAVGIAIQLTNKTLTMACEMIESVASSTVQWCRCRCAPVALHTVVIRASPYF